MKLTVDNRTGLLNDYYFQTLCLIYFRAKIPHRRRLLAKACRRRYGNGGERLFLPRNSFGRRPFGVRRVFV